MHGLIDASIDASRIAVVAACTIGAGTAPFVNRIGVTPRIGSWLCIGSAAAIAGVENISPIDAKRAGGGCGAAIDGEIGNASTEPTGALVAHGPATNCWRITNA